MQVVGGQREREVLDRMPVYGEPGIGKTALFESVRNATPSKLHSALSQDGRPPNPFQLSHP